MTYICIPVEWLDDICWWFCRSGCGFLHMKIVNLDGKFILGQFSQPFDSIPQMIEFYCLSKLPIKGSENISLVHPLANGCSLWYADVSVRTDSLSAGYVYALLFVSVGSKTFCLCCFSVWWVVKHLNWLWSLLTRTLSIGCETCCGGCFLAFFILLGQFFSCIICHHFLIILLKSNDLLFVDVM